MIENYLGVDAVKTDNNYSYNNKSTDDIDRDDFMTLLLAQLQHQDPLNPMESQEFAAQLAQFTSVEQLYNINDNIVDMKGSQDSNSRYQALDFIGKRIEAAGNTMNLDEAGKATGVFVIEDGAYCTVNIYDQNGTLVDTVPSGELPPGRHEISWDGIGSSGELLSSGTYRFEVYAETQDGQSLPVSTRVAGEVTRVSLETDEPLLYIGEQLVGLSQVIDIRKEAETVI